MSDASKRFGARLGAFALFILFSPAVRAGPTPSPIINPSQTMGICSFRAGTTLHTLTLLKVALPGTSLADHIKFFNSLPPGQAGRYTTNIAYIVVDTVQGPSPRPRVVWGAYGTGTGPRPGAIQQKLIGAVVWDATTKEPYVVLAQSRELATSIRVYQVGLTQDFAPLPLKLEYTSRLSKFEDVAPLSSVSVGTNPTDLEALQATAMPGGLSLRFQRERGTDSPVWNTAPYNSPVNIFFALAGNKWSSPDAKVGYGRVEKL